MNNENDQKNGSNQDPNNKANKNGMIAIIIATFLVFILVCWLRDQVEKTTKQEITYDAFLDMLEENKVESVQFIGSRIVIKPKVSETEKPLYVITYYTGYINDDSLVEKLNKADVKYQSVVEDTSSGILEFVMWNVFPFVLIFGSMWFLFPSYV